MEWFKVIFNTPILFLNLERLQLKSKLIPIISLKLELYFEIIFLKGQIVLSSKNINIQA